MAVNKPDQDGITVRHQTQTYSGLLRKTDKKETFCSIDFLKYDIGTTAVAKAMTASSHTETSSTEQTQYKTLSIRKSILDFFNTCDGRCMPMVGLVKPCQTLR